jgi:hypothetical protein
VPEEHLVFVGNALVLVAVIVVVVALDSLTDAPGRQRSYKAARGHRDRA